MTQPLYAVDSVSMALQKLLDLGSLRTTHRGHLASGIVLLNGLLKFQRTRHNNFMTSY